MYMRLLGYPAEKISILTTYNGQKHLIRDVINIRCADNPIIGKPYKVVILVYLYTFIKLISICMIYVTLLITFL